ncbi:adrenocortical dysplasia protein homolog isoform X1 [Triplophysa rosa]|uniref:adrenocortical dysplasia protein homolog isoform X1 n=1 Tax=Triplophysa rosa TaxID=992332 RepID=UPI002545F608|nr:adrenocortical dysplasia protein homolog isoform X1 [Triplophysa rosa]
MCDLSESQRRESTDACMIFLSDGSTRIPAALSGAAWERLQESEEKESFSDLLNAVVFVRNFKLEFDMKTELGLCQFYLKVDQITTVCIASKHYNPPSCLCCFIFLSFSTLLPSVREKIIKTWRSCRESSVNSLSSASGVSLSSLLGAWHSDIIINILNDAMEKITMSATCCPSVATPTHWHGERLRWKGQEQFIVPVPFLLISEEQRELMTADPSADCKNENANAPAPPHEESHQAGTSTPDQTLAAQDLISGSSPNEGQCTLEHTRLEVLCGTGEISGDGESPWDMFTPAPDLLGLEPHSQTESQTVLKEVTPFPLATSTQFQNTKQVSEGVSEDGITLAQRPQPTQISPSHVSGGSCRDPSQEHDKQHSSSPPSWIVESTDPLSKNCFLLAPPTKPNSLAPPTKPKNVHSDGRPFSYLYHPDPQVATALSHLQCVCVCARARACVCVESQDSLYSGRCVILGPLTLQMSTRELILKSLPVTSNYIIFLLKEKIQLGMHF